MCGPRRCKRAEFVTAQKTPQDVSCCININIDDAANLGKSHFAKIYSAPPNQSNRVESPCRAVASVGCASYQCGPSHPSSPLTPSARAVECCGNELCAVSCALWGSTRALASGQASRAAHPTNRHAEGDRSRLRVVPTRRLNQVSTAGSRVAGVRLECTQHGRAGRAAAAASRRRQGRAQQPPAPSSIQQRV